MTVPPRRYCSRSTPTGTAPAIEVLNQYVADPQVVAGLTDQLGKSWSDVRAGPEITGPFLAGLTTVLGPAEGHSAAAGPAAGLVGADRRCHAVQPRRQGAQRGGRSCRGRSPSSG